MTSQEAEQYKPEPFLTLEVIEGDAGTRVRCPELGMGVGYGGFKKKEAIRGLQYLIESNAQKIVNREDMDPNIRELAKKVVEELNKGVTVADLCQITIPAITQS